MLVAEAFARRTSATIEGRLLPVMNTKQFDPSGTVDVHSSYPIEKQSKGRRVRSGERSTYVKTCFIQLLVFITGIGELDVHVFIRKI